MEDVEHYTTKQVAELLKVNPRTVSRWVHLGQLPAVRLGRRYRISKEDLKNFLAKRRTIGED